MNNNVDKMCDKAIEIINNCSHANYISDEKCNALVSEIQLLKSKQDRSLASKISEQHENNLKHYVQTMKSTPDFSNDFFKFQTDCISLLNDIEETLYFQERFKS